jgi:hypothetical protein
MERTIVLKDGRSVIIRPIVATDFERSRAFFLGLDAAERRYLRRDVTDPRVVRERIKESQTYPVSRLIALHDNHIVADGSLEHERYGWGDRIAQIRLIVAPGFRRVGLGTSLARLLYVIAHEQDVARINVRMLRPQAGCCDIFHRLGFRQEFVLPEHVRDLDGELQDLVIMRCELAVLCDGAELAGETRE